MENSQLLNIRETCFFYLIFPERIFYSFCYRTDSIVSGQQEATQAQMGHIYPLSSSDGLSLRHKNADGTVGSWKDIIEEVVQ